MEGGGRKKGYAWAISAGFNAAFAAISAKFFSSQMNPYGFHLIRALKSHQVIVRRSYVSGTLVLSLGSSIGSIVYNLSRVIATIFYLICPTLQLKYALVVLFNVIMWGCYVNSMKSLSSLQATVTNFATNFLTSGMSGYVLFDEALPLKWFAGATLIVIGVIVLTKSSIENKTHSS